MRHACIAILLAAALICGCSDKEQQEPKTDPVRLHSPGSGPKRPLEIVYPAGSFRGTCEVTYDVVPVAAEAGIVPQHLQGRIEYVLTFPEANPREAAVQLNRIRLHSRSTLGSGSEMTATFDSADPATFGDLEATWKVLAETIAETRIEYTLTDLGRVERRRGGKDLPALVPDEEFALYLGMQLLMGDRSPLFGNGIVERLVLPVRYRLPSEPVGEGAKWTVRGGKFLPRLGTAEVALECVLEDGGPDARAKVAYQGAYDLTRPLERPGGEVTSAAYEISGAWTLARELGMAVADSEKLSGSLRYALKDGSDRAEQVERTVLVSLEPVEAESPE